MMAHPASLPSPGSSANDFAASHARRASESSTAFSSAKAGGGSGSPWPPSASSSGESVAQFLENIGLSEYTHIFLVEGFDRMQSVEEITEGDLDAMNVKRGHRRVIQRAVASRKGIPASTPLNVSDSVTAATAADIVDGAHQNKAVTQTNKNVFYIDRGGDRNLDPSEGTGKRKYRRHPKVDPNAPEKPPSAYVMFSNQIREELRGKTVSFTEIARIVGDRWKNLEPQVKEGIERRAAEAKENWQLLTAEYKKTSEYAEHQRYLKDFKEKHAIPKGKSGSGGTTTITSESSPGQATPIVRISSSQGAGSGYSSHQGRHHTSSKHHSANNSLEDGDDQGEDDEDGEEDEDDGGSGDGGACARLSPESASPPARKRVRTVTNSAYYPPSAGYAATRYTGPPHHLNAPYGYPPLSGHELPPTNHPVGGGGGYPLPSVHDLAAYTAGLGVNSGPLGNPSGSSGSFAAGLPPPGPYGRYLGGPPGPGGGMMMHGGPNNGPPSVPGQSGGPLSYMYNHPFPPSSADRYPPSHLLSGSNSTDSTSGLPPSPAGGPSPVGGSSTGGGGGSGNSSLGGTGMSGASGPGGRVSSPNLSQAVQTPTGPPVSHTRGDPMPSGFSSEMRSTLGGGGSRREEMSSRGGDERED